LLFNYSRSLVLNLAGEFSVNIYIRILQDSLKVTDVGHGSGDSILLQLSHPDVARPALLCGITSLSSHYRRAQERVDSFLSSVDAPSETPDVLLFEGDAVWRPGDKARSHPLSPHFQYEFDNVLTLDCAYHFNTRHEFLRQSFQRLVPGGGIALADICFSAPPGPILTLLLWRVLRVMPRDNIVTKEQYIQQMNNIGYEGVEMEDITPFVFPGFCNFLKWRGYVGTVFAWLMGWLQGQGLRFIIIKGAKPSVH
jgi:SAM-dependent methyltransferase